MEATTLAEISVTEFAASVVNEIAKKNKMNGMAIAPFIPGVTHDHPPCDFIVETCAYCIRSGNVFVEGSTGKDTGDIICKYRNKVLQIFEEMGKEIETTVNNSLNQTNDDDDGDDLARLLMAELGDGI